MTKDDFDYIAERIDAGAHYIPPHMMGAIKRYLLQGIPGGSFLTALLSNDLMAAFGAADVENTEAMRGWTMFLYNCAPTGSHGSPEKVRAWIDSFKETVA